MVNFFLAECVQFPPPTFKQTPGATFSRCEVKFRIANPAEIHFSVEKEHDSSTFLKV